jgi:hypothetical protein
MGPRTSAIVLLLAAISSGIALARQEPVSASGSDALEACRDILSEWARIEKAEYEQTGSYRAVLSGVREGKQTGGEFVVSTKPGHKLITIRARQGTEDVGVIARSPRYGFALQRAPGKPEWLLMAFLEREKEAELLEMEQRLVTGLGLSVLQPLGTAGLTQTASRFFEKSIKHVKEAHYYQDKHRLEFARDTGYHGTIDTDPERGNVVIRFQAEYVPGPGDWRESFVRELVPDGKRPGSNLPLCKSIIGKAFNDQTGKTWWDARIDFSDYSFDPPADELFLLSHYGLPEPSGQPTPRSMPNYAWLLVAAVICAALGVLSRLLWRRKPSLASVATGKTSPHS